MKFELTPYQQRRLAHLDVDIVENRHAQVPSWRQSRTAEYQEISAELERRLSHVEVELADPPAGKAGSTSWLRARTAELGALRIELRRREFEQ